MSSPTITVRISPHDLARLEVYVHERNSRENDDSFTVSDLVRMAIKEKIDHLCRSSKAGKTSSYGPGKDCSWCFMKRAENVSLINGACPVCKREER